MNVNLSELVFKYDICKCIEPGNIIYGCFGPDIPILLYNGMIRKSQDIKIGDLLMGDDNTERIVEDVISGIDEMFEVTQVGGIKYTVNSKHILLLKNIIDNDTEFAFDMSTEQYMSLNDVYKPLMNGYKINHSGEVTNTTLSIKLLGKGTYYGWAISGNKNFLLSDNTVVHNCNTKYCSKCNNILS